MIRSLLIPGYDVQCRRCGGQYAVACDCRPIRLPTNLGDKPLGAAKDLDLATVHEPGCVPPRCPNPRCRAIEWWREARPRRGPRTWKRGGGRPAFVEGISATCAATSSARALPRLKKSRQRRFRRSRKRRRWWPDNWDRQ